MLGAEMAFMRMRSPSNAPLVLRRVGSIAMTAILGSSEYRSETTDQLVGQRRLTCTACARDAEDGVYRYSPRLHRAVISVNQRLGNYRVQSP